MAARCAHKPARWVCLQPALALSSVPDAVLGTEHPSAPFAIEDSEVADREPKGTGLQAAIATLVDQQAIARLSISERIDSHGESIAGLPTLVGRRESKSTGCRIRVAR